VNLRYTWLVFIVPNYLELLRNWRERLLPDELQTCVKQWLKILPLLFDFNSLFSVFRRHIPEGNLRYT
jgi:hypothetical protein